MLPRQREAFEGANPGTPLTVEGLGQFWEAGAGALLLLWAAWVALHAYKYWSSGRATWTEAGGQILRAVVLVLAMTVVLSW